MKSLLKDLWKYRNYIIIGFLLMVLVTVFVVLNYPKDISRIPFFIVLLLLDVYLWSSLKKVIFFYHRWIRTAIRLLYWFPTMLLAMAALTGIFYNISLWDNRVKTYVFGFIFVFYAAKFVPLLFLFLNDLYRLIRYIWHLIRYRSGFNKDSEFINTRSKFMRQFGLIAGGLFLSSMLMGMLKWAYDFKVMHHDIYLPHLPATFEGLRIVQISDLHLGSMASHRAMQEAVERINAQHPDMIFFTGDLVNAGTDEALPFRDILSGLKAKEGIYASLGNHDYGEYRSWNSPEEKQENMELLYRFFKDLGWRLLNNESIILERDGGRVAIAGSENWSVYKRFPRKGNIEKTLQHTADADVVLLLSHDPTHWVAEVTGKHPEVDITFAGHTHGMQFGIEIPGVKWSPAKFMYKYWAGLYSETHSGKTQYLYVNRGLGAIGYPGRIGILPEITVIDLHRGTVENKTTKSNEINND
jgi:hypothetical protein